MQAPVGQRQPKPHPQPSDTSDTKVATNGINHAGQSPSSWNMQPGVINSTPMMSSSTIEVAHSTRPPTQSNAASSGWTGLAVARQPHVFPAQTLPVSSTVQHAVTHGKSTSSLQPAMNVPEAAVHTLPQHAMPPQQPAVDRSFQGLTAPMTVTYSAAHTPAVSHYAHASGMTQYLPTARQHSTQQALTAPSNPGHSTANQRPASGDTQPMNFGEQPAPSLQTVGSPHAVTALPANLRKVAVKLKGKRVAYLLATRDAPVPRVRLPKTAFVYKPLSPKMNTTPTKKRSKPTPSPVKPKQPPRPPWNNLPPASSSLHTLWEIPAICHFIWLFQKPLCMLPILPEALETALAQPQESRILHELLSKLLIDQHDERQLLFHGEGWPYDVVCEGLHATLDEWYRCRTVAMTPKPQDPEPTLPTLGSRPPSRRSSRGGLLQPVVLSQTPSMMAAQPSTAVRDMDAEEALGFHITHSIGPVNPLEQGGLHELPLHQRARLIKALCDFRQEHSAEFRESLQDIDPNDMRVMPFGVDSCANQYLYMGFDDCRIYRQTPTDESKNVPFRLVCDSVDEFRKLQVMASGSTYPSDQDLAAQLELMEEDMVSAENKRRRRQERKERREASQGFTDSPEPLKRSARLFVKQEEHRRLQEERFQMETEIAAEVAETRRDQLRIMGRAYLRKKAQQLKQQQKARQQKSARQSKTKTEAGKEAGKV